MATIDEAKRMGSPQLCFHSCLGNRKVSVARMFELGRQLADSEIGRIPTISIPTIMLTLICTRINDGP
jgi:hypothetical protein